MEKDKKYYMKIVLFFFILFGFGYLPPMEPITPMGMKMLGILIALIYGWTFIDLIWPSIWGWIAIGLTGAMSVPAVIQAGLGNATVLLTLFILLFMSVVNEAKITDYIAVWIMTRKVFQGNAWAVMFALLFTAWLLGGLVSVFAGILITWGILYTIAKQCDYQKGETWLNAMLCGIVYFSMVGETLFPFKVLPVTLLGYFNQLSGLEMSFAKYTILNLVVGFVLIIAYLVVCKFILRVDISKFNGINVTFKEETLTVYQKKIMVLLILMMVTLFLPDLLPVCGLKIILSKMGLAGIVAFYVSLLCIIRDEGKPLGNIMEMFKSVHWGTILLMSVILPFGAIINADGIGIAEWLASIVNPIFSGQSMVVFYVLIIFIPAVLTNVVNNMITGFVFIPIVCAISAMLGVTPLTIITLYPLVIIVALITPAGNPVCALLHTNTEWISVKDAMLYGLIPPFLSTLVAVCVGVPIGNLLF